MAFVDADDWILPEMLKEQLELLVRENGDMILGGYLAVGEKERESFRQTCREEKAEGAQPSVSCRLMDAKRYVNDFLLQSCSRCWSILFRREADTCRTAWLLRKNPGESWDMREEKCFRQEVR